MSCNKHCAREAVLHCWLAAFVCATALTIAGTADAQTATQSARTGKTSQPSNTSSEARQLFEATCSGCHGLDGRGGERGPDIATRPQIVQLSDAEILEVLQGGRPAAGMPPFDGLGPAKLKGLVAYIRKLQGKREGMAVALQGNPASGKNLFFGKARCSECHNMHGAGGFIGRDLTNYAATLSPAEIHAKILGPGDERDKSNRVAEVTLRDSQKFSGVIRNEDNFSIELQSLDGTFHLVDRSQVTRLDFSPQPIMPANYSSTLTAAELDDLVSYLITVARSNQRNQAQAKGEEDE
jgi:cytochrome c oxidase cbb3-type subunit III